MSQTVWRERLVLNGVLLKRLMKFCARTMRGWRKVGAISPSYQFAESLERVLLDADERQAALLPDPPAVAVFPPPGVAFDPDSFALLTAVYSKAIEGQPASAHEGIAKRIIALASKGERDPDKLRHGALGQSTHLPWSAG